MLVMIFTMSAHVFANEIASIKMVNTEKYELKINQDKLANVLELSNDQIEMSKRFVSEFEDDMVFASFMNTEESRNAIVRNAVKKNIKNMHYVLDDKQYKKYLMFLNITLVHRGFDVSKISD
jgi:hypothetical protein